MLTTSYLLLLVFVTVLVAANARPKYPWETADDCKDKNPHCLQYFLNKKRYPKFNCAIYGPSICQKFCGYCSSDICKDRPGKEYWCYYYKKKGYCRTDFANRNCRRTCKKCT